MKIVGIAIGLGLLVILVLCALSSFGGRSATQVVAPGGSIQSVDIKTIVTLPELYAGQSISINGIVSERRSYRSGLLLTVDALSRSGFIPVLVYFPQQTNRFDIGDHAKVYGRVTVVSGTLVIHAERME